MAVSYGNSFHKFSVTYDDLVTDQHVLLFDLVTERGGQSVFDRIRALDPSLRNCSCIVLRGRTSEFLQTLKTTAPLWTAIGDTPIVALAGSLDQGKTALITEPPFRPPGFPIATETLRSVEVRAIVERNRSLLGPHEKHHYVLPSGDHGEAFLRLAQALQDPIEVTRICDWVMPSLGPNVGIIGDTGTLLPLLWCIAHESYKLYGWNIPFRIVDSYPVDHAMVQSLVAEMVQHLGPAGRIVFLVSVSSSGRLLQRMVGSRLLGQHSVVVICDTDTPPAKDAFLSQSVQRWPVDMNGQCQMCEHKERIYIDPRTYERVLNVERKPVLINPTAAERHLNFWAAADRAQAVRLHFDLVTQDRTVRHYGIYIDVMAMLGDPEFGAKVVAALQKCARPTVALVPRHSASEAVKDLIQRAFGETPTLLLDPGRLSDEIAASLTHMSDRDVILIADDALVSGTTLYNVRPQIHSLFKNRATMPAIEAFVVVARPAKQSTLRDMRNRYRDQTGARFTCAEEIYMPDHADCPWCRERSLLSAALPQLTGDGKTYGVRRLERLTGAFDPPFLLGGELADAASRSCGSFFGPITQSTGFAAAASAIYDQWLRAVGEKDEIVSSTTIHYVDVAKLINNYFADAFAAAVFRIMKAKSLTFVGQNQAIIDAVELINPAAAFPCFVPELLWAAFEGKLPPACALKLLQKMHDHSGATTMLAQLIRLLH